ncbi:Cold-regulated 413 plasma membrane protein 2 [Rhynchospora pubera]|uniref:Cold-regulated 413 plasma membrane protein 2 n=1 Tax=Rhynchospora pubera TaxID=906938 RepID=A0AAV8EJ31_9POAL|nr:Cold-regulated 413 plasma membrane protein 2 [Rhynchospora pubera]KAJ4770872.1 Cold-regulated 413 plasma membrane protein 2 [Rhynchospora pubera]KAJ4781162.1 Cold-regulated 413 plasma membrane protein 2 [Rhynchospora pubera]KAJ4788100.1 Cold-regulated 413 plasma membrane protein 2 [Rhynchospora pubera]KAJ4804404.1 Cold-regulated 413 plasma membrane protein 2 [Rhynchospora pubera]
MGKLAYLAMDPTNDALIQSDFNEIGVAMKKLANHAFHLSAGLGFGTVFLKFLASFSAIYLLILDRTNWRTNMLTSLLVPYIFLSLPAVLFSFLRGEFGKWVTFIGIVLRLFFPRHYPHWMEMPGSLLLLLVVAPSFIAETIRDGLAGVIICLAIGCYLMQEHIRASGGFRNSFTKPHGVSNTMGIILILVYPIWRLVLYFL